jgi:hypothetical protein
VTAKKTPETCVTAGNVVKPKNFLYLIFLIWVRRVLRRVIAAVYVAMRGATDPATGTRASEVPGDRHAPLQTYYSAP